MMKMMIATSPPACFLVFALYASLSYVSAFSSVLGPRCSDLILDIKLICALPRQFDEALGAGRSLTD
jgi:hypothetical protein